MRVTTIELHPDNSPNVPILSFRDPTRQKPYNVVSMAGLDAEAITPRYYGTSQSTGQSFFDPTLDSREIVMKVQLNPSFSDQQTYSDLRDGLYRAIASSRTGLIQLQFKNESGVIAAISGWITKFESPQFEKMPGVQLTIETVEPMLTALDPVTVDVSLFNPVLTNIQDVISTAHHGFIFEMSVNNNLPTFTISNPEDDSWSFNVAPGGGFLPDDLIHFSSIRNNKELYVVRDSVATSLIDSITTGAIWPILFPGDNLFTFLNDTMLAWENASFYPSYWGV